jgi:hypothetical protein
MPKVSKATASVLQQIPGAESRSENFPGGWTVNFETETEDVDTAGFYKGMPDDQCQTLHMGYVLKGTIRYRTAAGEEVFEAGDAYLVLPGHTSFVHAGTEYVEFSPTEEQVRTYARVVDTWQSLLQSGDYPVIYAP